MQKIKHTKKYTQKYAHKDKKIYNLKTSRALLTRRVKKHEYIFNV